MKKFSEVWKVQNERDKEIRAHGQMRHDASVDQRWSIEWDCGGEFGRFRLACSSPLLEVNVCSQLHMSEEGVMSDEILSNQENSHECPEVKEVLSLLKTGRRDEIDVTVAAEQWIAQWNKANKNCILLFQIALWTLQITHFTRRASCNQVSHRKSYYKHWQFLKRWLHRVSVMLHKFPRITDVQKLRAFLSLEKYFNNVQKKIFNNRLTPKLEE